jgi:N-acetylglutamate synthase-like GNAT family acetyltransferase
VDHVEIKRASLEDVETILHLQMRAYLSEAEIYNDYSIPPLIQTLKEIKQEFSQQVFLKATEEDGNILGSVRAYLEKETAYIRRLIVKPESQNKGIGTKLMQAVELNSLIAMNCLQDTRVLGTYTYTKNLDTWSSNEYPYTTRL